MTRKQVHLLIRTPELHEPKSWNHGGIDYYRENNINVGYTVSGELFHFGFSPGGYELLIGDRPLWEPKRQPDPNPTLLALDPNPLEFLGTWLYLALGVTSSGYHNGDQGHRAVTAFVRGQDSELFVEAKPADTSRYRRG